MVMHQDPNIYIRLTNTKEEKNIKNEEKLEMRVKGELWSFPISAHNNWSHISKSGVREGDIAP